MKEFRSQALADGDRVVLLISDEFLVGIGYLSKAVMLASDLDLTILGMEGFDSDGSTVTPRIDYIADFSAISGSWSERVAASGAAALRVASSWQCGPEFVELILKAEYPTEST